MQGRRESFAMEPLQWHLWQQHHRREQGDGMLAKEGLYHSCAQVLRMKLMLDVIYGAPRCSVQPSLRHTGSAYGIDACVMKYLADRLHGLACRRTCRHS